MYTILELFEKKKEKLFYFIIILGLNEEQLKTPEQPLGNSQYLGLFGLKRSSSSDAESSPCDTTIRRLDSFLSDIKEGLWRSESGGDLSMTSK